VYFDPSVEYAAQMEQEIQRRVITLTKQHQDRLAEEIGIQSSLTVDDMKAYLNQVIMVIQKTQRHNHDHSPV
jgi:serine protease inhibitor ecotin